MSQQQGHILAYEDTLPQLHSSVFVAATACLIGDIKIDADSSVWFGANTLWAGVPAKPLRELEDDGSILQSAEHYRVQALRYR